MCKLPVESHGRKFRYPHETSYLPSPSPQSKELNPNPLSEVVRNFRNSSSTSDPKCLKP